MKKVSTTKNKVAKAFKKVVKVEKKLTRAVKAEARSVNFQVKKLSNKATKGANKIAGKVKHMNPAVLLAEAVAGITLVATLGAYSVYLVRHGNKKMDLKNVKINILREVHNATEEAKKIGKMSVKKIEEEAKKLAGKR